MDTENPSEGPVAAEAVDASGSDEACEVKKEEKAMDFYQRLRSKISKQLDGHEQSGKGASYDRLVAALALSLIHI